jgi:hypothetical protein
VTLFQPPEPPTQVPAWRPPEPRVVVPLPPGLWQPLSTFPPPQAPRPKGYYRRVDVGFTIALCALGVVGAVIAVLTAVLLPTALAAASVDFFEAAASSRAMTWMLWGHLVLLAVTIGCSILLLRRKRTAFWLPLAAGLVAAVGYWIVVAGYLAADHSGTFVA